MAFKQATLYGFKGAPFKLAAIIMCTFIKSQVDLELELAMEHPSRPLSRVYLQSQTETETETSTSEEWESGNATRLTLGSMNPNDSSRCKSSCASGTSKCERDFCNLL